MAITDELILPSDVEVIRVSEINDQSLNGIAHNFDDWVVTRPGTRTQSIVIADELARLLKLFRRGARVVDAIIEFSRVTKQDPHELLDDALPAIQRFFEAKWLVPAESPHAVKHVPWYLPGDEIGGLTVSHCVQVREDSQVYQARSRSGRHYAIKTVDERTGPGPVRMLAAEAAVLISLKGAPCPMLLDLLNDKTRHCLVMEWCTGNNVAAVAHDYRQAPTQIARKNIRTLLVEILEQYAYLHGKGITHGDVHPGNILLDRTGSVRLIDFGLARVEAMPQSSYPPARGGVLEYYDPALAHAFLDQSRPPLSSASSEQYSLGALCYRLVTGHPYLSFSKERIRCLEQILKEPPLRFVQQGVTSWPQLEEVLSIALAKDDSHRFVSVDAMRASVLSVRLPSKTASSRNSTMTANSLAALVARVERRLIPEQSLYQQGVAKGPRSSAMYGAAGISYFLLRSAKLNESPSLLSWADQWAERAAQVALDASGTYVEDLGLTEDVVGKVSHYHTPSGIELVRGLVAQARGDEEALTQAVSNFIRMTSEPCENLDATLGISSVLTGSALLASALRSMDSSHRNVADTWCSLIEHGHDVAKAVWEQLTRCGPIAEGSGPGYLGVAHGWAGILHGLLTWSEVACVDPPADIKMRLDELGSLAEPDGRGENWPIRPRSRTLHEDNVTMPGWCHGAPGYVHLWNAADRVLSESQYRDIAIRAAWCTYDAHGGGASVCCGEVGRFYALLNMYRHSGEQCWLERAQECVVRAAKQIDPGDDLRDSLYKGELGVALAILELDRPEQALHPLFEAESPYSG